LAVFVLVGCASFDKLKPISEEELNRVSGSFPQAETCGHCHSDIYDEWRQSPHAHAYTNEAFRNATSDYQFDGCLACHAPDPEFTKGRPSVRTHYREEGVTCVSCHLEEGTISGPVAPTGLVSPHPVDVASDRYRDSKFCGRCHEGTYGEWKSAAMDPKQTCQECHMPGVTRKMTQSSDLASKVIVSFEEEVPQKRHVFRPVPSELESPACSARLVRSATGVKAVIRNLLPHAVPTGDFGVRVVSLEAFSLDQEGEPSPLGRRELTRKLGTEIPAGESLEWDLPVLAGCRAIEIRMVRLETGSKEAVLIFHQGIPLP
jgi:nitrate/TMAO reductase-like tetraheme cytochrome c subunit